MAKKFIPKSVELTDEEIKKIKEKNSFLTNEHINEIKYWNDAHSPYTGTIICEDCQYLCYPYDKDIDTVKKEYPGIEIWEVKK